MFTENEIKEVKLQNHHSIGYYDYGKGKPVIMLHGFPDTAKTFRHQVHSFNQAGYRVICPYLPGYEYSSAPNNGLFVLYDLAKIISEFLDALVPGEQAIIIGHDWGASILRLLQKFHRNQQTQYHLAGVIFSAVPLSQKSLDLLNLKLFPGFKQLYRSRNILYFQLSLCCGNFCCR